MLKRICHTLTRRFENQYNYDAKYLHDIIDESPKAWYQLMRLSGMNNVQGPNLALWGGAALAGTLHGDCGPCAQLVVDRIIEQGGSPEQLSACVSEDWAAAGPAGLGFQFAKTVLEGHDKLTVLSEEIVAQYGKQALIAASYAATSFTIYPLLKRALGNSKACTKIEFNGVGAVKLSN